MGDRLAVSTNLASSPFIHSASKHRWFFSTTTTTEEGPVN